MSPRTRDRRRGGCAAEDAGEGANAASPRRDAKTPWMLALAKMKLFFSPLRLQTTTNDDAEHSKTNPCSLHLFAASDNHNSNDYCYSCLLRRCCRLAESGTLLCQAAEGCRGLFCDQSGALCSRPLGASTRGEQKHRIISCDKHGTRRRRP